MKGKAATRSRGETSSCKKWEADTTESRAGSRWKLDNCEQKTSIREGISIKDNN
jgi:hypothetical protein